MMQGIAFIICGFGIGMMVAGIISGNAFDDFRQSAIEAGAGEYRLIDPATGKTEFVWTTSKEEIR